MFLNEDMIFYCYEVGLCFLFPEYLWCLSSKTFSVLDPFLFILLTDFSFQLRKATSHLLISETYVFAHLFPYPEGILIVPKSSCFCWLRVESCLKEICPAF